MSLNADPFQRLAVGDAVSEEFAFTSDRVGQFADLVDDHAPVHIDAAFAKGGGFADRIVHGMFVTSVFSGLLGQRLPGPESVINQFSMKMHKPVAVGDTVSYTVKVTQISAAVRAVVLKLEAVNAKGELVLSGAATCSLPNRSS